LAACLDFQCDKSAGFFQDEIHFVPGTVAPVVQPALLRIERAPCLEYLKKGLLQPETRVHAGRYIGRRFDSGKPGGKAAICPEQLWRLDERGRWVGGKRSNARNQATGLQQVQIPVRGRMTERRVARQVGLVENLAGALRGQHHDSLKIGQAGDGAQLAQIPLQISLHIRREPQAAVRFRSDLQCWREATAEQP